MTLRLASLAALLLAACAATPSSPTESADAATTQDDGGSVDAGAPADAAIQACRAYGAPVATATVTTPELPEASGIAASAAHPGVFFTHNDSGDTARFFAIDLAGTLLATFNMRNAQPAIDIEDIDLGPCEGGRCVFVGDIGDNKESRAGYVVYRVREPAVTAGKVQGASDVTVDALPFTYPDGSHNAETLLVHPLTGAVYVLTKESAHASRLYRFPALTPGISVVLTKVGEFNPPDPFDHLITAGQLHPSGTRLLLRTYNGVYELRGEVGDAPETLLTRTLVRLPVPSEVQGEAISYLGDGLGYATISEGNSPTLYTVPCR